MARAMNLIQTPILLGLLAFSLPVWAAPDAKSTTAVPDLHSLAKASPAQIKEFFNSAGYQNLHRTDAEFIKDAFQATLQRAPDKKGFDDWTAALQHSRNPKARQNAVEAFLKSAEYASLHQTGNAVVVQKKDTPRNPANVLFNQTGVFVNVASAFPADRYARLLKMGGVKWITLQIDNGGAVRNDNVEAIESGWVDAWRKAGFKVGYWGCPRGVRQHDSQAAVDAAIPLVQADAALAVKLTSKYHGELYIANCEAFFQSFGPKDPTPALNRVYVEAFKRAADNAGIGKIPRALSSMGRVALDMQPWIDGGWDALPQAYWNSYAVYQPSLCVDFYTKEAGWPIERIHPTIATYPGEGEKRSVSLQDYDVDLRKRATTGFSYYLPESYLGLDERAYAQLSAMASP